MPAQVSQSPLAGLFDVETQRDVSQHAQDPIQTGGGDMPPGVLDGLAKLVSIKFSLRDEKTKRKMPDGSSAAGKPYALLSGVAVAPPNVITKAGEVVTVANKFTRFDMSLHPDKVYGVPKSKSEMILLFMDMLKSITGNQNLFPKNVTPEVLDTVSKAVVAESVGPSKKGLFVAFATNQPPVTKEYPNPITMHRWHGGVKNYTPPSMNGQMHIRDDNAPQIQAPTPTPDPLLGTLAPQQVTATGVVSAPPSTAPATPAAPAVDLQSLVARADAKESAAQKELVRLAMAVGKTHDECENADSWQQVAGWCAK